MSHAHRMHPMGERSPPWPRPRRTPRRSVSVPQLAVRNRPVRAPATPDAHLSSHRGGFVP